MTLDSYNNLQIGAEVYNVDAGLFGVVISIRREANGFAKVFLEGDLSVVSNRPWDVIYPHEAELCKWEIAKEVRDGRAVTHQCGEDGGYGG